MGPVSRRLTREQTKMMIIHLLQFFTDCLHPSSHNLYLIALSCKEDPSHTWILSAPDYASIHTQLHALLNKHINPSASNHRCINLNWELFECVGRR